LKLFPSSASSIRHAAGGKNGFIGTFADGTVIGGKANGESWVKHQASCQCGALQVEADRDPDVVVACNCRACQRRGGAPFGVGAYFRKSAVTIGGDQRTWSRVGEAGRKLTNHFCPQCGTTVFWTLDLRPDHVGVALGCLATPVAEPARAIWLNEKHDWVRFPEHWPHYGKGVPDA
jgi:hypothetical protein